MLSSVKQLLGFYFILRGWSLLKMRRFSLLEMRRFYSSRLWVSEWSISSQLLSIMSHTSCLSVFASSALRECGTNVAFPGFSHLVPPFPILPPLHWLRFSASSCWCDSNKRQGHKQSIWPAGKAGRKRMCSLPPGGGAQDLGCCQHPPKIISQP